MRTIGTGALPFALPMIVAAAWSCGGKATEASPSPSASASACDWDYQVLDPSELLASASLQVAVFDQACPTNDALARGDLTQARVVESVAVGQAFPSFCDLPTAAYCMVAVATSDCSVVGFGATPFDLSHHKHVTTSILPLDSPQSQCTPVQQCVNDACVSSEAGVPDAKPDGEAGAPDAKPDGPSGPWTIVAAGQLPLGNDPGLALASPNAVLTPSGFVITYRERHATDGSADGVRVFVGDDGAMGTETRFSVPSCFSATDAGGAAAWSDLAGAGFMALSKPACSAGDTPSMHVSLFDAHGVTTSEVEYPLPGEVKLAPVHGAAPAPNTPEFLLAGVASGDSVLYTFDGLTVQSDIDQITTSSTFAEVASSTKVRATLADAKDFGFMAGSVTYPGSNQAGQLGLQFLADKGALTAWDDKAMAIVPLGDHLVWGASNAVGTGSWTGEIDSGPCDSLDLAVVQDHVVVAAGRSGEITLWTIDGANGELQTAPSAQLDLGTMIGAGTLPGSDGKTLSMAAGRGRVLIVWGTADAGKPPGMYAMLASPN